MLEVNVSSESLHTMRAEFLVQSLTGQIMAKQIDVSRFGTRWMRLSHARSFDSPNVRTAILVGVLQTIVFSALKHVLSSFAPRPQKQRCSRVPLAPNGHLKSSQFTVLLPEGVSKHHRMCVSLAEISRSYSPRLATKDPPSLSDT